MKTIDAANGRWREILPALGIPSQFLSGKHQPCLLCGGKDRARFTDLDGRGSYFCNQCGAGTGMQFLMKFKNWDFAKAASEVDAVIGKLPKVKPFKCGPSQNARAWEAMRDEFFDGIDLVPACP